MSCRHLWFMQVALGILMCCYCKKKPIRCEIVVTTSSSIMQHLYIFFMLVWGFALSFVCVPYLIMMNIFCLIPLYCRLWFAYFLQLQCMSKHLAEHSEIKIMFFPHSRRSSVSYPKSCLPFLQYNGSFSHNNYLLLNCSFIQTILLRGKCCLMMFFAD